jgi:hypothetical protein
MTDEYQKTPFLYVLVKEKYTGIKKNKVDTVLRIVYWQEDLEAGYNEQYVIYGKRPNSKTDGAYVPYRLSCSTIDQVYQLVKTVVSCECDLAIELHQYNGYNDFSDDEYHINWQNTYEDYRTELVAFDMKSISLNGYDILEFRNILTKALKVLETYEVV